MSQPTGCVVTVFVCGSNTPAWKLVLLGRLPEPETTSTLPLRSSAACTGLIGMGFGSVCHCPCTFACAPARPGKLAKQIAATNICRKYRVTLEDSREGRAGVERCMRQPPGQEGQCENGGLYRNHVGDKAFPCRELPWRLLSSSKSPSNPVNTGIGQERNPDNELPGSHSRKTTHHWLPNLTLSAEMCRMHRRDRLNDQRNFARRRLLLFEIIERALEANYSRPSALCANGQRPQN